MQELTMQQINPRTKTYRDDDGVLQALAFSIDGFDNFINYYCLVGVWEPQNDTQIVSNEYLGNMYKDAVK